MTAKFQLVIDCADPEPLARFWVAALGYEFEPPPDGYDDWDDYWRAVGVSEDELGLGLDPHHRSGRGGPADLVPGGPGEEDAQEPAAPRHHRQRRASDSDRDQAPARGRRGAAAGSARHRGIRAGQEHGRCGHHIPAGAARTARATWAGPQRRQRPPGRIRAAAGPDSCGSDLPAGRDRIVRAGLLRRSCRRGAACAGGSRGAAESRAAGSPASRHRTAPDRRCHQRPPRGPGGGGGIGRGPCGR